MIHSWDGKTPDTSSAAFIAWNAEIYGEVLLGKDSSVWFGAVLRGDESAIKIGDRTNIQDNSILHGDHDKDTVIGDDVIVGHGAILHACKIGSACLIGMGSIILSGSVIGEGSLIGAGTLIPEGKIIPPGSLVIGSPGKVVRSLTPEDRSKFIEAAAHYIVQAKSARLAGGERQST